ncbi:MAG TPA: response regulator [Terriglobales bacterium]
MTRLAQPSDIQALHRTTRTILLVEDEDFVRNVTRDVLELNGWNVLEATDAESALHVYREHANSIDLLLTDVVMPGQSGLEFASSLLVSHPNLSVVFMSGYTDNPVVRAGFSDPRMHYLQKPFSLDALTAKIQHVLESSSDRSASDLLLPRRSSHERPCAVSD